VKTIPLLLCTLPGILAAPLAVAQTANGGMVTLRGGGLEVSADLSGWTRQLGTAVLDGNYVRLGQYTKPAGQVLSLLVDRPPEGVDLAAVCQHSLQNGAGDTPPKVLEQAAFAGKPACLFTLTLQFRRSLRGDALRRPVAGAALLGERKRQGHRAGREELERVVASLSATRYQSAPGKLQQADISDPEVAMAERYQGCSDKSKDFTCRALAAFKVGTRPSGRPSPTGVAGISIPVIFDKDVAGVLDITPSAGFIVVSNTGFSRGESGTKLRKEQEKAAKELIAAVKAGKQPPGDNWYVAAARSANAVKPAALAERSMIAPNGGAAKLYLRETSMGLVCLGLMGDPTGRLRGMLLEVYPAP
jgi:hypothetical protein